MPRRRHLAALAVLVAILPACGGGGGSGSSPPCPPKTETRAAVNGEVTVCAYDINFGNLKTITAPAAPLKITLINKGSIAHTFKILDNGFELATPKKNDVKSGTVTLAAGTYDFECTISGHAAAGMKGKMVIS
jgi:hypothetical protein